MFGEHDLLWKLWNLCEHIWRLHMPVFAVFHGTTLRTTYVVFFHKHYFHQWIKLQYLTTLENIDLDVRWEQ